MSSNTRLLDDKTRNRGNVIITLRGQQCFPSIFCATLLQETVSDSVWPPYDDHNLQRGQLFRVRERAYIKGASTE